MEKYTVDEIKKICSEKDLSLVGVDNKYINGKNRRCACIICNKRKDKGIQYIPVEKIFKNKKPCQYCNHSKLKETFKDEMAIINPYIEILSEYKNWNTKVKCRCKVCGNEWDGTVSCLLYGNGCKICGHVKRWDSRGRKTTQDVIRQVAEISPDITVLGEYTGYHDKIDCKCEKHNTFWEIQVSTLVTGATNCPDCQLEKIREKFALDKNYVYKKLHNCNPYLEVRSEYKNTTDKIDLYCSIHDFNFSAAPSSFLYKESLCCPMCMCENNKYTKLFSEDLYNYYVEDVYGYIYKGREIIDGRAMISFLCKKHIDKGIQKIPFHNIKTSKCCCRYCTGYLRSTDDFKIMLKDKQPSVSILGEYKSAHDRIECKCNICNHVWNPIVYNLLSGYGCPNCKSSSSERKVGEILTKFGINYVSQKRFDDCKDKNTLPFDYYLPDNNIAIEYDGEQHYMPVNWNGQMTDQELMNALQLTQKHDEIKTDYCTRNNIGLIRIPYWEKNNLEAFIFDNLVGYNVLQEVA